jgi:hypothetical protein
MSKVIERTSQPLLSLDWFELQYGHMLICCRIQERNEPYGAMDQCDDNRAIEQEAFKKRQARGRG